MLLLESTVKRLGGECGPTVHVTVSPGSASEYVMPVTTVPGAVFSATLPDVSPTTGGSLRSRISMVTVHESVSGEDGSSSFTSMASVYDVASV